MNTGLIIVETIALFANFQFFRLRRIRLGRTNLNFQTNFCHCQEPKRRSHACGRSAAGGQSRAKRNKIRDCRALSTGLAMTGAPTGLIYR